MGEERERGKLALEKSRQRKKRGRGTRTVCLGGNGEIGNGHSLSLKRTWYPGYKEGQHNYYNNNYTS